MVVDNKHVLVVEDSMPMGRTVQRSLRRVGLRVTTAENGRDAWNVLDRELVDLVITDYQMPLLNGSQLCGLMRADKRYRDTPIIMLTGKGYEIDCDQLREQWKLADVFFKPFSSIRLLDSVQQCLFSEAAHVDVAQRTR